MTEEQLHISIVDYLNVVNPIAFYFHVPNGSKAAPQYRAKLKRMGVKAGVSDLLFILPGGKLGCIELKTAKGTLSGPQEAFEETCDKFGADYHVCRSIDDVGRVLRGWGCI